LNFFSISAAMGRSSEADDGELADAEVSMSTEPVSGAYSAIDSERLPPSAEVAAVQYDSVVDQTASTEAAAASVTNEVAEGAAEVDNDEASQADQLADMPGTPASLPSLASEPEDTCTPLKFVTVRSSIIVCFICMILLAGTGSFLAR